MTSEKKHFIVIDDSELDCYIAERLIEHTGHFATIRTFTNAEEALKHISGNSHDQKTVILLDVLMPLMNGFEFVEAFEQLPVNVQSNYTIIALTTSLSKHDIQKINSYRSVTHFIDKPIAKEKLLPFIAD